MRSGRIQSVRSLGSKLLFLDVKQAGHAVQVMCAFKGLDEASGSSIDAFKQFSKIVRKGDSYEVTGYPHRTASGELSIRATSIPVLLSPSLHQIPDQLHDDEVRAKGRHVEMLVDPHAIQTLRVRHLVEQQLNGFLSEDGFTKVNTPILTAGAGGAIARPFETEATELEGQKLNLRIAPELWLKRLVVGGMEKVYEIGPSFRNEGVDATHNPEFSTCEFYEAFATLEDLIVKTEKLLQSMKAVIDGERSSLDAIPQRDQLDDDLDFRKPFQRLEFIPTIEKELGRPLPALSDTSATRDVQAIFEDQDIPQPANPTLPRLLDALASRYIEPRCQQPTFITNHPACLSPLSKHFTCPTTGQTVAARAELFIAGREYANMYEEENSPFAQRQKFEAQLQYRDVDGESDSTGGLDEDYLKVLEWGLPPTGGWGCGIDRLVMLFAGRHRISDVLPFGTLRNVVALGRGKSTRKAVKDDV